MTSIDNQLAGTPRQLGIVSRHAAIYIGAMLLLLAMIFAGMCLGRYSVDVPRAMHIIWLSILDPARPLDAIDERIIILVRVPRVLLAAFAGAALAASGAALQGVFRNPLVSPQVLGISQGAAFGGAIAILLGVWGRPLCFSVVWPLWLWSAFWRGSTDVRKSSRSFFRA